MTQISATWSGGERYSVYYNQNVALTPPWTSSLNFGSTTTLSNLQNIGASRNTLFYYNPAAELTKVTLPAVGDIQWEYGDANFANLKTYHEVSWRHLRFDDLGTQYHYQLYCDPNDAGQQIHNYRGLIDQSSGAEKRWSFHTDPTSPYAGLLTSYDERTYPGQVSAHRKEFIWQLSPSGSPYISDTADRLDPGQTYEKRSRVTQAVDGNGNLTVQNLFNYGDLVTPARMYNNTYLSSTSHTNIYIRNRLANSTLTAGGQTTTLVENTYDDYSILGWTPIGGNPDLLMYDPAYASIVQPRGNRTMTRSLSDDATRVYFGYNSGGDVTSWRNANGVVSTAQYSASTNYLAPTQVVPNGNVALGVSMTFNSMLGLTSETDANGVSLSIGYDAASRASATTSPYGAVTSYNYATVVVTSATTNGRVVTTTRDGLGRTKKVEGPTGIVETEYAPCACSPLGKVRRVSKPHASGETPLWTTYSYDALGRTTLVTLPPDGGQPSAGSSSYVYQGNTVRVTDPSGKWKLYTQDAFGNLTQVREANPDAPDNRDLDYITTYAYNAFNKLTLVTMPRPTGTQYRTFTYNAQQRLASVQQPENGTTTYGYDSLGRAAWKQDAKGQKVVYSYDTSDRVTMVQRYLTQNGPEVTAQRTTYYYDQDPDGGTGGNWAGRVAKILHGNGLVERFRYTPSGLTASKSQSPGGAPLVQPATVDYIYNNEGKPMLMVYPEAGRIGGNGAYYPLSRLALSYSYDINGMLYGVNRADTGMALITNAQYGSTGRLSSLWRPQSVTLEYNSGLPNAVNDVSTETFSYNALGQMTGQAWAGISKQYNFTAGANDGRVSSIATSPGETVSYSYDTLGRLVAAATASPSWGLGWVYDGFGNRLQQNVTKGSAISVQMTVDAATNRLSRADIVYDGNGNMTNWTSAQGAVALSYDIENRVAQVSAPNGVESYVYSAANQRVLKTYPNNGSLSPKMEVYGAAGELLGEYDICAVTGGQYQGYNALCEPRARVYFAGRLMLRQTPNQTMTAINTDRLGSAIQTFPYGDTLSTLDPDKESFATYTRDGVDGLDYAQNRYYSSTWGRFLSADPYQASGGPGNPASWNRYAYVEDDPINRIDPSGRMYCVWMPDRRDPESVSPGLAGWFCSPTPDQPRQPGAPTPAMFKWWGKALEKLSAGNQLLHSALTGILSEECQKDMTALAEVGISAVGILAMSMTVEWNDAFGNETPAIGLFVPGSSDYSTLAERMPNLTISQYVSGSIVAASALPGSSLWGNIYFNSRYVAGLSTSYTAALLMHELMHALGPEDPALLKALGFDPVKVDNNEIPSSAISAKLSKDCFQ